MTPTGKGELLARGRTAEVYGWSDGQVLKLFFDWCPPEWIQREVDVGRHLASTSLPTPRLMETVTLDGRQGIVFHRAEGPSMLSLMGTRPWLLPRMARQFARLHTAVHDIAPDMLSPLRPHLHAAISTAANLPAGIRSRALDSLAALPDGQALCHFDFHPDQIAITQQGPMILDWMTALQGDPLADVARTSVLILFAQAPYASWLFRTATNLVRRAFYDRYLSEYLRLHPAVSILDMKQWMVPVAAARIGENVPGEQEQILAFLKTSLEEPMVA